jgi:hypothetical protein
MRRTEIAYLAGFFDGEGSVSMALQGGKYLRIEVSCSQNTATVLWMFVRGFRGNIYEGNRCYQWKIYGNEATKFLRSIIPYLIVKRLDAEEAVRAFDNRDNKELVTEIIQQMRMRHEQLKLFHDERTVTRAAEREAREALATADDEAAAG